MRLKDIIESWSDLPGQHERQKTPEELQAEEEAELHRQVRQGDIPDKAKQAHQAGQKLSRLMRLKQQQTEREQQAPSPSAAANSLSTGATPGG